MSQHFDNFLWFYEIIINEIKKKSQDFETFELRTVEQRHVSSPGLEQASPHHFRPQTIIPGSIMSKQKQEPPLCNMLSIDQLPIS